MGILLSLLKSENRLKTETGSQLISRENTIRPVTTV